MRLIPLSPRGNLRLEPRDLSPVHRCRADVGPSVRLVMVVYPGGYTGSIYRKVYTHHGTPSIYREVYTHHGTPP